MYSTNVQRFSSGYDKIDLTVLPIEGDVPVIQQALCEDVRYWIDDVEEPLGSDHLYFRLPSSPGHILTYAADDVEYGAIGMPLRTIRSLGIEEIPIRLEFLVARDTHSDQLDQFHL